MYDTFIFRPLYNGLVGIIDLIPGIDIGIAVIIFTIIVKFILYPLSKSSLLTQVKMKEIEPEVNKIKAQYASDRQTQTLKIMELYRSRSIRPFAGILLVLIQLPILIALISVFYKIIPEVNPEYLYSFVSVPVVRPEFLGFIDLTTKSLILSIITAVIQYLQLHYSIALQKTAHQAAAPGDFSSQLASSMQHQMKYMLPIFAFITTYWIIPAQFPQAAAIIAIYWSVSTLFTLAQELYVKKKYLSQKQSVVSS